MARLRMTNADYVAIAVSPALVMALVGSLVFFLIEVFYVGEYVVRLNYVFALFVFATVLIARIAIEMGSERAALFSMPLGLLTYLALMRFVPHQGPLGWLINFLLLGVVWWSAHKLTWDCTVIDDNEDSSGEGLLGKVGLDTATAADSGATARPENELLAEPSGRAPWWKRLLLGTQGPHAPGVWVLYFSLAALPLFGLGQSWIPASDVGRRRYAFRLLAVYVASALCLLVTTSFLGLRRYLRQRRVEMPAPMAATWVSLGAVLILLVMFTAALIPRPNAEYALSQAPWQAGSPNDLASADVSVSGEGTIDPEATNRVTSDNPQAPQGNKPGKQQDADSYGESPVESSSKNAEASAGGQKDEQSGPQPGDRSQSDAQDSSAPGDSKEAADNSQDGDSPPTGDADDSQSPEKESSANSEESAAVNKPPGSENPELASESSRGSIRDMFSHPQLSNPFQPLQTIASSLSNLLKFVFYVLLGLAIAYFAWTRRSAIARALADIFRELREFFARLFGQAPAANANEVAAVAGPRRRTFGDFNDPFTSGRARSLPPVELVRYTFEAFEAWAGDHGRPRSPDQTPQELVRSVLPPQTPMYDQARRLAQLYSEAAYSAATVPREAAASLQSLWQLMRSARSSASRNEAQ
jgi:hypothetical protein